MNAERKYAFKMSAAAAKHVEYKNVPNQPVNVSSVHGRLMQFFHYSVISIVDHQLLIIFTYTYLYGVRRHFTSVNPSWKQQRSTSINVTQNDMIKNPGVYNVMNRNVMSLPTRSVYGDTSNASTFEKENKKKTKKVFNQFICSYFVQI